MIKKVYFKLFVANLDLMFEAYVYRDYSELYKSFSSVAVSITVIDLFVTYGLPFVMYWYKLWSLTSTACCFKGNWYLYKK